MEMAPLAPPAVPPPPDFLAGARRAPAASLRHGALEDVCGLPALLCGLAVTCGCAMGPCTRGPGPTPLKAEGATFAPAVATDNGAISCVSGTFDFTNNKRPSSRVLEQKIRQSLLAILALRRSPFLRSSRWGRSLLFTPPAPCPSPARRARSPSRVKVGTPAARLRPHPTVASSQNPVSLTPFQRKHRSGCTRLRLFAR
ncbi:hypothetical protein ACCO45_001098 [Purpureocillium lilacinum]|uniref:Uncharacterized protein n=1 Tax=Purpureocillium lilacinum TaxID=33203 RepID=A0ACC4E8N9_PURLI